MSPLQDFLRRLVADERGISATIVALCMMGLIAVAGIGIDLGYLYTAKLRLQASTDAAALAGAQDINTGVGGTAKATATSYSAVDGQKNDTGGVVTMAAGYPQLKCLTSIGVSCTGPDNANAIVVRQQTSVPTFFAKAFGIKTWNVAVTSVAGAKGGSQAPLDVMIILDTTGSMNTADPSCTIKGATRLDCALDGVRTLLRAMPPCSTNLTSCGAVVGGHVANPIAEVGLMVFPGLTNAAQVNYEFDCGNTNPAIAKYGSVPAPVYQIIPLTSDYRPSSAAALNTNSSIVIAARGGGSGCKQGISAVGGMGTYYSDAIAAAQAALTNTGRAKSQKVIIFLSDGDAGAPSPASITAAKSKNQCQQAITTAANAAANGTWIYSIAYGAPTAAGSSCPTDTPAMSACTAMQKIASDPSKFYSDNVGGTSACTSAANSISNLSSIFAAIVTDVTSVRLLPDDAT